MTTARAVWMKRQLLPRKAASVADAVRSGGWVHTGGGTGAYVAMFARIDGFRRKHLDRAAFETHDVLELPAVRDATMLVPPEDAALALAVGRRAFGKRLANFERRCGVSQRELRRAGEKVMGAVAKGARTPDQIRSLVPARALRELGEEGKKLGATTTLPLALRLLQADGQLLRVPDDHRLDAKAYAYEPWPSAIAVGGAPAIDEELDRGLAIRYAKWASPATAADFAWWADLPKRKAAAVFEAEEDAAGSRAIDAVLLLPFRDNYLYLRRGLAAYVDDPAGMTLLDWNGRRVPLDTLESLHTNAIIVGGELHGVWEWDPERESIAWRTLGRETSAAKRAMTEEVERVGAWIAAELQDHRFYPFDTQRTRAPRIAFARSAV